MSKKSVYLIERSALDALMKNEIFNSGTMLGSVRETLEKPGTAENAGKLFILYDNALDAIRKAADIGDNKLASVVMTEKTFASNTAEETTLLALKKKHGAELVIITDKNQVSNITSSPALQALAGSNLKAISEMGREHNIEL